MAPPLGLEMDPRWRVALLFIAVAGCGGEVTFIDAPAGDAPVGDAQPGDGPPGDGVVIDAAATDASAVDAITMDAAMVDAATTDAAAIDAATIDAATIDATTIDAVTIDAPPSACGGDVLSLTASQVCAISYTGNVTPCSVSNGTPSLDGYLEVRRPDGARGYICAYNWTSTGGYYFRDRRELRSTASGCCGGSSGSLLSWPAASSTYGIPHGPTRVGRQETEGDSSGDIRHNPFTIVVSNSSSAAAYQQAKANWMAWSGDGQAHPAPDGSGSYYFPGFLVINYIVVPTTTGKPVILIAPEPSLDAAHTRPLGHPTLGACGNGGGGPLAFIGGDIQGTTLTNGSGRYGFEATVTRDDIDAAAALFNCYGIPINDVIFTPP